MKEILLRHWFQRPGRFSLIVLGLATATTAIIAVVCASSNARESYRRLNALASGIPAIDVHHRRGDRFDHQRVTSVSLPFRSTASAPMLFRGTIARHGANRLRCVLLGIPVASLPKESIDSSSRENSREVLLRYLGLPSEFPMAENDCLVSQMTAENLGLQLGDELNLLFRRRIQKVVVRAIIPDETWQSFAVEPSVIVDLRSLQVWANLPSQVDRVRFFLEEKDKINEGKAAEELTKRLDSDLVAAIRSSAFGNATNIFRSAELGLGFATALAGAMSLYILLNTIRMSLLERRSQFAILRCIGATPQQIYVALIQEVVLLSMIASALGVGFGAFLGKILQGILLNTVVKGVADYQVPWLTVLSLSAITPVASVAITTFAYWEQRDVSPLENFRESQPIHQSRVRWWVIFLGLALWGCSFAALLAIQSEELHIAWAIPAGLLMLVSYLLFLPLGWLPLLYILSKANQAGGWFSFDLASYQLQRRPERTSLTAGFLVIALCGAIGLGQALLSNIDELRRWYRVAFAGDVFLLSAPSQLNDSDDPIRSMLIERMPDSVQWMDSIRFIDMEIDQIAISVMIREFPDSAPFPGVLKRSAIDEAVKQLRDGKLFMNAIAAKRLGKKTGDRVLLQNAGQGFEFEIAGTFVDFKNGGMSVLLDRKAAQKRFAVTGFDLMAIQCPTENWNAIEKELRGLNASSNVQFVSGADLRSSIDASISSVVMGITVVVITSFAVGALGLMSTLAMNVTEQSRDFALLRLIGMVRSQVICSVVVQGMLIGFIGCVFGWLGGVTTSWVIHACSEAILGYTPEASFSLQLPLLSIAGALLIAALASLVPAIQATRVDPKNSLQYEE